MRNAAMSFMVLMAIFVLPTASLAAEPHAVCSIADFGDFIEQFSNLSREEQSSCFQYPVAMLLEHGEELIKLNKLSDFDNYGYKGRRFVFSVRDLLEKKLKVSKPFFTSTNSRLQKDKLGYFYKKNGDEMMLMFSYGGDDTEPFESLDFKFLKKKWMVVGGFSPM